MWGKEMVVGEYFYLSLVSKCVIFPEESMHENRNLFSRRLPVFNLYMASLKIRTWDIAKTSNKPVLLYIYFKIVRYFEQLLSHCQVALSHVTWHTTAIAIRTQLQVTTNSDFRLATTALCD